MKQFIWLLLGCFYFHISYGQMRFLHPLPTGDAIRGIAYSTAKNLIAVGDAGMILQSTDSGKSWVKQPQQYMNSLIAVSFTSPNIGFIAGSNGLLLKTTDGGKSWTKQNSVNTTNSFTCMFWLNASYGWLGVTPAAIYFTRDGGNSWTKQTIPLGQCNVIYFRDTSNGYIGADNKKYASTTNHGAAWSSATLPNAGNVSGIYFPSATVGYVTLKNSTGNFFKTTNSGSVWKDYSTNVTSSLLGMCVYDQHKIFTYASAQNIFVSNYAGTNLTQLYSGGSANTVCGAVYDTLNMVFAGEYGDILRSNDGGVTFKEATKCISYSIVNDLRYFDSKHILAAAGNSVVYKIDAYHSKVDTIHLLSIDDLFSIAAWDTNNFICGTYNGIQRFVKGKRTKSVDATLGAVLSMSLGSGATAVATTGNGVICRTLDSGKTWAPQNYSRKKYFRCIAYSSPSTCWVVGDDSFVGKSTDSGKTWTPVKPFKAKSFKKIYFSNPKTGYLTNDLGNLYKSTDSGKTWSAIYYRNLPSANIMGIHAVGNHVWFSDFYGRIFHSQNGGVTWTDSFQPTANQLNNIIAIDSNYFLAAGGYSTIITNYDPNGTNNLTPIRSRNLPLSIYPNPFSNQIFVATANLKINRIQLFEASGKLLIQVCNSTQLDTENIQPGIYIIAIETDHGKHSALVIK